MSKHLGSVSAAEVLNAETFAAYCQQRLGIPQPSYKNMNALRRSANQFFKENPKASWQTMVRVADWCCNNRRRYEEAFGLFHAVRFAWKAGYLPELDPVQEVDENLEARISAALAVETDDDWRRRLLVSSGQMRGLVYDAWQRSSPLGA